MGHIDSGPTHRRGTVRKPEHLVQAEDRKVPIPADVHAVLLGKPGLRGIFYKHQPSLVTPAPPAPTVLWKAEVVRDVQGPDARFQQFIELAGVGLEAVGDVVEDAAQASGHCRLDLRSVMVGGHKNRVSIARTKCSKPMPQPVPGLCEEHAGWVVERERKSFMPMHMHRRCKRRPNAQPGPPAKAHFRSPAPEHVLPH